MGLQYSPVGLTHHMSNVPEILEMKTDDIWCDVRLEGAFTRAAVDAAGGGVGLDGVAGPWCATRVCAKSLPVQTGPHTDRASFMLNQRQCEQSFGNEEASSGLSRGGHGDIIALTDERIHLRHAQLLMNSKAEESYYCLSN